MILGVISDTHGSLKYFDAAIEALGGDIDEYLHLGDFLYHGPRNPIPEGYAPIELAAKVKKIKPVYVTGNCDSPMDLDLLDLSIEPVNFEIIEFEGVKFLLSHGWNISDDEFVSIAQANECKVILSGHTHISDFKEYKGFYFFNPGSTTLPKNDTPRSVGKIIIRGEKIIFQLIDIELKKIYMEKELEF